MSELRPISALGAFAPRRGVFGALRIEENADVALASLALRSGQPAPSPFDLMLPGPGGWRANDAGGGAISAFWMGPEQWMIEAPGQAETDFARALSQAAPGCSVTEQTDGWAVFEIIAASDADALRRLLEKLVNIDFAAFAPGGATRTLLDHQSVFVIRRAEDRAAVAGMRSAAGSLWHALSAAAMRLEERPF